MARVVTSPNQRITIEIEIPPPQTGVSKLTVTHTVTVQIEPSDNQEGQDSVPVQETEPPVEPTDTSVIIY